MLKRRKTVIAILVTLIVGLALISVGPVIYASVMGPGVKTEELNADGADPAETEMDGEWGIAPGTVDNITSVGFTFNEILPAEQKVTSGSTQEVTGNVTVDGETLTAGNITVNMGNITTDNERRDVNVRMKILNTDEYPNSTFEITEPVDLSAVPEDGTPGEAEITGDLTIRGQSNEVTQVFDVLRDGERVIIAGDLPFNRLDYGVEASDFVAAKIAEEGELNILAVFEKES